MNVRISSLLRRTLLAAFFGAFPFAPIAHAINHNPVAGEDSFPATLSLSAPSATWVSDGTVTISVTLNLEGDAEALTTQPVTIIGLKQPTEEGGEPTEFTLSSSVSESGQIDVPGLDPNDCGCNLTLKITGMTEGNGESEETEPVEIDADGGDSDPGSDASSSDGGGGGGGPKFDIGMGKGEDGKSSSGTLKFEFTQPDEKMYKPEGLIEKISPIGTDVVRVGGVGSAVRQVLAPGRFTEVEVVSDKEYRVFSYAPTAVEEDKVGGLYVKKPSAAQERVVTVKNPGAISIANTTDEALFHQVRWGKSFRYELPVENNRYKVELQFVELHKDAIGANTFNVKAQGATKLSALDVRSEAGARYKALTKEISTDVVDGMLKLDFTALTGGAHVAALKVISESIPAVANTADADLYQTARAGDFSYNLSLPNGTYEVQLHFVEPIYNVAAARLFDVAVEGASALSAFDIRAEAGARDRAHVETIPVTLTDGTLDIDFLGVADKARLSALVVRDPSTSSVVVAINSGGAAYVAADSTSFSADVDFTGGQADVPDRVVHAVKAGSSAYTATDSTVYSAETGFVFGGKSFAGALNRMQITTQDGSADPKLFEYNWVANPETGKFDEIILSHAGGLKKEGRVQTWSSDGLSYDETVTLYNADNTPVSKVVTTYEKFPFGMRKIREVRDPQGTAPMVETWTYVEGSGNPDERPSGYGRVLRHIDSQKGWTDYTYDDDTRIYATIRGALNSAPGTLDGARVQTNTYSSTAPRATSVVTIDGQEVSRSWSNEETSGTLRTNETRTATVPGAAWSDASNLVSKTVTYTAAETDSLKRNQVAWTESPDGTMTFYAYAESGGDRVTTRETGAPNVGKTTIVAGTRTLATTNAKGHQIAEETIDIASGLTLNEWQALEVDALGRPTEIGYGDGTVRTVAYVGSSATCGSCSTAGSYLIESEIDRNGITTLYAYDELKRRTETTRLGVSEKVIYDAADRIVEQLRIGTSGPAISQQKITYDLAGRVVATEDALGNITTIAYSYPSEGGLVTTTSNPATAAGSGTRIETTYADGRVKEISGTAVSPLRYAYGTWSTTGQAGEWTQEIKIGESASETEWTKTYSDLAGRTVKTEYPAPAGSVFAAMSYNIKGQLVRQTDPDGVQTLFAYDAEGEREFSVLDWDRDGVIDHAGLDRITHATTEVVSKSGTVVRRATTRVWHADNTDAATVVSISEQDGYGNQSWQTDANGALTSAEVDRASAGSWTVTQTAPDGSQHVQTYAFGRLASTTLKNSAGGQVSKTDYAYDAHGRVSTQIDARTGAVAYTYTDRDEVFTTTANNGTEVTTYAYDALGNQLTITRPDASVTANEYHLRNNQLKKTSGSQTYPVEYAYDLHGRMKTMTTWQNATSSTGAAVSTWNYDTRRGWLAEKLYADSTGPAYEYTPAGRLTTRTWVRTVSGAPLITTYAYNNAGDLNSTDYSDTTPDVTITHTRFGAQKTVTDATGTRTFTYTAALRLDQEQLPAYYGDRILTRSYQGTGTDQIPGRSDGFELGITGDLDQDYSVIYGYDTAGRLNTVTDPNGAFTYGYLANSHLRSSASSAVHSVSYAYESHRDVLATLENKVGVTSVSKFEYGVNNLGQRESRTQSGTAFSTTSTDDFTYNAKGEVVAATNATLTARNQSFAYDDIGNRLTITTTGGTTNYTANGLNQYTAIASSTPAYDPDGNQTSTGLGQAYIWDAENRLICVEPLIPGTGDKKVVNTYDAQSRRVRRAVFTYTSGAWALTADEKFIYDEWNVVAVLDATDIDLPVLRTHTWGLDLSGSPQGAGGVGGLLAVNDGANVYHYTYDANGNVSEVLNSSGAVVAHYEYDAFGDAFMVSGIYALANEYRFSTKSVDASSGLYYYGYRYYNPSTGRWLNRDPLMEAGGTNLYAGLANDFLNQVDPLGESPWSIVIKQAAKIGIKKALKEYIENTIKKKMSDYASKQAGKHLMDDAISALDLLDTAWWEFLVECVPVAGDIYGAGKMAGQLKKVDAILEKIEKIGERAAKVNPGSLKYSGTVSGHIERKYNDSGLMMREIIEGVRPDLDGGSADGLKWLAPGSLNGKSGTWELVITTGNNTVVHWLFKR